MTYKGHCCIQKVIFASTPKTRDLSDNSHVYNDPWTVKYPGYVGDLLINISSFDDDMHGT